MNYPRNLGPANLQNDIDPGNRVDTRDVRLYYFRDAHRVAELINRNVRSLNKVGYDSAHGLLRKHAIGRNDLPMTAAGSNSWPSRPPNWRIAHDQSWTRSAIGYKRQSALMNGSTQRSTT